MTRGKLCGFTLIELMTVVVVISILVVVGYPSYQDHVRKGKRAEGRAALLKAAQVLERWYSDRNNYGNTPVPPAAPTSIDLAPLFGLAAAATVYSGEDPSNAAGSYQLSVAAPTAACPLASCFALTATPKSPFVDPDCGDLTLSSTGVRDYSAAHTSSNTPKCKW